MIITFGVPQGSLFGLVLFSIFMTPSTCFILPFFSVSVLSYTHLLLFYLISSTKIAVFVSQALSKTLSSNITEILQCLFLICQK